MGGGGKKRSGGMEWRLYKVDGAAGRCIKSGWIKWSFLREYKEG